MKKREIVKLLCNIGLRYFSIMTRSNIGVIFNYIEFLSEFEENAEIPPIPPSIANIIQTYGA